MKTKQIAVLGVLAIAALFASTAQADNPATAYKHMRNLTPGEAATVSSLTPFTPPNDARQWGFLLAAKDVPINVAGLPREQAFTRTTLIYFPTQADNPSAATVKIMWPEGTRDARGQYRNLVPITGVRHDAGGRTCWLFDVEDHLNALRNERAEWFVEQRSMVRAYLDLSPSTFSDGIAWAHVDPRVSSDEQIGVGPVRPRDNTYALALQRRSAK